MVKITLDKERTLKLGMRGIIALQEKTGVDAFKGIDIATMTSKEKTALIWACLLHDDHDLDFDYLTDLIDLSNIASTIQKVAECIMESVPSREGNVPLVETPQDG
jgi:hypothetical protein